jgi:hypothetical protein
VPSEAEPIDSAIAPLDGGQFAIAEVYANTANGNDVLALFSVPAGTEIGTPLTFGIADSCRVAIASDGSSLSVVTSDVGAGVVLYGLDGGSPLPLATLSAGYGSYLSAASCGTDCTLVGWIEGTAISSSGGFSSLVPRFAVVNGEGCGLVQSLPVIAGQVPVPVAVAASPGSAIFAYALNGYPSFSGPATEVFATICTP